MRCPTCKIPLMLVRYESVPVQQCGECGGVWLRKTNLARILQSREHQYPEPVREKFLDLAERTNTLHEIVCTTCGKIMVKRQFLDWDDIHLDQCPQCGGVWFDPGELVKVQWYWEYAQDHPEMWNWSGPQKRANVGEPHGHAPDGQGPHVAASGRDRASDQLVHALAEWLRRV